MIKTTLDGYSNILTKLNIKDSLQKSLDKDNIFYLNGDILQKFYKKISVQHLHENHCKMFNIPNKK